MKQQILSVALALCLFISSQTTAHASQEDLSPQEDVLTEESSSEPAALDSAIPAPTEDLSPQEDALTEESSSELITLDSMIPTPTEVLLPQENVLAGASTSEPAARDSAIPTPTEVYESMTALQNQDAYKEGTTWTDYEPYSDKNYYSWKGGPLGGTNIVAVGCVAFAFTLSDAAFGSLPARMYGTGGFSYSDIKVGDILRVNNAAHTVIVLEVSDVGVVVAEGNNNGKVHWGRTISKDDVMSSASHYITRYPEGYIPPDDPTANEVIKDGTLEGGLTWSLTKAGTLTISGKGAMPDYGSTGDQPWNSYNSQIRKIVIQDGVTSIGSCAFWECKVLSVEIPSGVTTIGNSAFRGSSVISVNIPSSVTTIGDSAFRECQNLSSATMSEGLEIIDQNAFRSCIGLTSIALPGSITEVGAGAFYQCTEMTSAAFAAGGKQVRMGDNMFTQCYKLMSVTLPQSVDCIGEGMFQNCHLLAKVEIPQGAESIGGSAFASSGLTSVIIPDSVTTIGIAAFANCSLTDIYFTGTEAQWNVVSKIGDTASAVSNAVMHYEYTPEPSTPSDPSDPSTPSDPSDPSTPSDPSDPSTPSDPSDPSTPSDPTTPPSTTVPIINDGSGKEGWEAIKEAAANTSDGKQISVDMNGTSVVPGDVIDSMKGQDVTISFDMGNGITWLVNGKNVTAEHANDVDLSVQVGTSAIPENIVNNVAKDRQTIQLSLAHSGDFGYSAVLMIDVDSANKGLYANLFYYNESTGKLEFVTADQINTDGIAELTFTHASDYVIVVSNEVMKESSNGTSSGNISGSTAANGSSSRTTTTVRRSPNTGDFDSEISGTNVSKLQYEGTGLIFMWLLLIGVIVIAMRKNIICMIQKKADR